MQWSDGEARGHGRQSPGSPRLPAARAGLLHSCFAGRAPVPPRQRGQPLPLLQEIRRHPVVRILQHEIRRARRATPGRGPAIRRNSRTEPGSLRVPSSLRAAAVSRLHRAPGTGVPVKDRHNLTSRPKSVSQPPTRTPFSDGRKSPWATRARPCAGQAQARPLCSPTGSGSRCAAHQGGTRPLRFRTPRAGERRPESEPTSAELVPLRIRRT
jgi:hypothetical protein